LAWSDDSGASFAAPRIVSGGILDANHPVLSVSEDGRVVQVFQGRDPERQKGWAPPQAYLEEISDSGRTSPPLPVPGRHKPAVYPSVVADSQGRVLIAWSEPGQNGRQVVLVRGR
jgi:hypothetical protein